MIVEWFLNLVAGIWEGVGSLFPDWEMPPELADPNGALGQVFALGQGLEPFADWNIIAGLAAIPLAVWVIGIIWKLLRMAASHIPFFGGNG